MSTKTTGNCAMVYRVLDESGEVKEIRARVTDDIVLKKGQTLFFNDFFENIQGLAKKNIISPQEAEDRIAARNRLDNEYNQETVYSLRAGNPPEGEGLTGKAGASKL